MNYGPNSPLIPQAAKARLRAPNNYVALIGHSMQRQNCEQTYSGTANRVILGRAGWPFFLGSRTRGQFIFPESCNFAVNSTTSTDMVSTALTSITAPSGFGVGKTQLQAAIECAAQIVAIDAEHNDRINSITADTTIANYTTACNRLTAAGKMVLVFSAHPSGNTADTSKRISGTQLSYRNKVRDWVLHTMPGLWPGQVYAIDGAQGLVDLASATAGDAIIGTLYDSVHPNNLGGYRLGLQAGQAFPALPYRAPRLGQPGDTYDATNNPNGNLLVAGQGFETGSAWSGVVGGITQAGTRPATWGNFGPNGALQAGTLTVTGSMVTTSSGQWFQINVTGTTGPTAGANFTIGPANITLGNLSPGDILASYGAYEVDAGGTGFNGLGLRTMATLPSAEQNTAIIGFGGYSASSPWDSILSDGMLRGTWNGDLVVPISGSETAVSAAIQAHFAASATVNVTFRLALLATRKGGYR